MTTRCGAGWGTLLVTIALGFAGPLRGQEAPPRTFTAANGVTVEVRPGGAASDADILAALEEAARAVRDRAALPPAPPEAVPVADRAAPAPTLAKDGYGCGDGINVCHLLGYTFIGLPPTLLWEPPLANPHEPRMALVLSDLRNQFTRDTVDTSIGATVGIMRVTDDATGLSVQQDVFANVQTRFSHWHYLIDAEYRFGLPLTFAWGPWEAKTSFEHTSTHQGNGSIRLLGYTVPGQVRNEGVLGLARWCWDDRFRVYGQFGYGSLSTPGPDKSPARYDWGVEWSPKHSKGFCGAPFAAFDMELRGDQNFCANMTTQVGWQWRELGQRLSSLRLALEYYDGKSPFGGFFFQKEHWLGVGLFADF